MLDFAALSNPKMLILIYYFLIYAAHLFHSGDTSVATRIYFLNNFRLTSTVWAIFSIDSKLILERTQIVHILIASPTK